jgi:NAD(P)H dehydrogenase (quinone)
MRALVVFSHPVPESFGGALHAAVVEELVGAGHQVDDCDLNAEAFDPVMNGDERRGYHTIPDNTAPVQGYVDRLLAAEMLVIVSPIWNFGWPAILKGYLDRVFLPDISFKLREGRVRGSLTNIKRVMVITTYGATRWQAWMMGDPPRKYVLRTLRSVTDFKASVSYLAQYDMNRCSQRHRARFLARVRLAVAAL